MDVKQYYSKKALILYAVIFIVALVAYAIYDVVEHEIATNEITIHGNVDIRQVDLGFRVGGRIAEMFVEEGDKVQAGQVIAMLDNIPYQHEVAVAQAQVQEAGYNLNKFESGNRPEEIKQAQANYNQQRAAFINAKTYYQRQYELVQSGVIPKQLYDDAAAKLKESHAALKSAQEQLKLMQVGFRHQDISAMRSEYEAALARLGSAKTDLNDTILLAPEDGFVLTRVQQPGAVVAPGANVYSLSLPNPVRVRAYLGELDLGRVKPGMKALVYTDSYSKPFEGQVGYISSQAEFTPKNIQTEQLRTSLVYLVRIIVEDPNGDLRQGMPVTVKLNLK
jgi:HlyD family secretion protein